MPRRNPANWRLLALAALISLGAGCDDDSAGSRVTLDNLWPNADGNAWTYELRMSAREGPGPAVYGSPSEVPPLPSRDELAAWLEAGPSGAPGDTGAGVMRLRFDGQVTTESGVTAQNLTEEYYARIGDRLARCAVSASPAYLRSLAAARPDLRAKLRALSGGAKETAAAPSAEDAYFDEPLFLHGYAWEKTEDHIANYGDVDGEISWLYLTRDLHAGDSFELQLVPDLAPDVYLRGWILERRGITVETGSYDDGVACLYALDYGIMALVGESGESLGFCRPLAIGVVVYAAGVGPVYSLEQSWLARDEILGSGPGQKRNEARLVGFGGG